MGINVKTIFAKLVPEKWCLLFTDYFASKNSRLKILILSKNFYIIKVCRRSNLIVKSKFNIKLSASY